jgi:hypothetical protein
MSAKHSSHTPLRSDRGLLAVAAVAIVMIVVAGLIALALDVPLDHVTEDPSATTESNPLTGVLSDVGVLVWWTGAVVAFFAALVLRRRDDNAVFARYLMASAALTTYLTIDDLFLIHDELIPATPLPQPIFLGLLVAGAVWFLVTFKSEILTTDWRLILIAGFLFGGSLAFDLVSDVGYYLDSWDTSAGAIFVEDALKLLGGLAWTTYLVRTSTAAVVEEPVEVGSFDA